MRRPHRARVTPPRWRRAPLTLAGGMFVLTGLGLVIAAGCAPASESAKNSATVRATRRAFDGAPPVIAHDNFGMTCVSCHNERGMELDGVGFAPPSPHELTEGMSAMSRCRQCHVFRKTESLLVDNGFIGLRQDLRRGQRLNPWAPPTIPHKTFMRENCAACHSGAAAREEILTPHPERARCRQCHVPTWTREEFLGRFEPGS